MFILGVELNRTELEVREACAVALRDYLSNTLVALGKDIKGGNTNNYKQQQLRKSSIAHRQYF